MQLKLSIEEERGALSKLSILNVLNTFLQAVVTG